jgi:hypothetical protein
MARIAPDTVLIPVRACHDPVVGATGAIRRPSLVAADRKPMFLMAPGWLPAIRSTKHPGIGAGRRVALWQQFPETFLTPQSQPLRIGILSRNIGRVGCLAV